MATYRLDVDWIRCSGHGLCAELAPEVITLDDWGFPIVRGLVPQSALPEARRACDACPSTAIRLVRT